MKLFVCYLGGRAPGCKIELHDVAFCVGESIESCHESLKKQWFGETKGLHIDAYALLTHVDGYEIVLEKKAAAPKASDRQLYFINLGGYDKGAFIELHKTGFYVAQSLKEAKDRAKKELGEGLAILHTDDALDVDDCLNIADYLEEYQINLAPSSENPPVEFTCGYFLIP